MPENPGAAPWGYWLQFFSMFATFPSRHVVRSHAAVGSPQPSLRTEGRTMFDCCREIEISYVAGLAIRLIRKGNIELMFPKSLFDSWKFRRGRPMAISPSSRKTIVVRSGCALGPQGLDMGGILQSGSIFGHSARAFKAFSKASTKANPRVCLTLHLSGGYCGLKRCLSLRRLPMDEQE